MVMYFIPLSLPHLHGITCPYQLIDLPAAATVLRKIIVECMCVCVCSVCLCKIQVIPPHGAL